jgi:pyruvate dehydrogenase E1 component
MREKHMNEQRQLPDSDPVETGEWQESIQAVIERHGHQRAGYLLGATATKAYDLGTSLPVNANTPYLNTIPVGSEPGTPGDDTLEWRIRTLNRWNAMATVVRANRVTTEYGGHIASFASSAVLYDMGLNHFWRAPTDADRGDLVFFQGHAIPGIYARAYMEGRISEAQLLKFRAEVDGGGLSSYPHPWLMPDFWQFPTVSMGLGPIMAIYQARFMKYLHHREIVDAGDRKVWAFLGDGETDEPESLGAISLAGRERLDNLVFVINCNLQRLDGPVRGNGKIIQELEGVFRGAGWNVIKVIWGSGWDELLARDHSGLLRKRMEECVDGEYQAFKSKGGAYTREHFFGKYPELLKLVEEMSDDDIWRLARGGHDPRKVYAAYQAATEHTGQPTVILAKTVKGYGMGVAGEGQNITHQQKKMGEDALKAFRDRFDIPVSDAQINDVPFHLPAPDSAEAKYLKARRDALGGPFPQRRSDVPKLEIPELKAFAALLKSSDDREFSTTMAFVRVLNTLVRDKKIGQQVVPIVPDESRTFGMEGMFRQLGIYAPTGQLYKPEDADQLMYYREDKKGQVLQEGINEAGAMCSWMAAASAYANHGVPMIPFYIYYSMFGFQRIGDFAWAAGDMRCRGFLVGGTAGRTTLAGEGLQHQDGHSHILASTIPNCISYDPTFAYEVAVIVREGLRRMFVEQENVYFYLTVMNENYTHPAMPEGAEEGIVKGLYLLQQGAGGKQLRVQLVGSGTILREVLAAADLLRDDFGVAADVWSATSFTELARDGDDVARWNMLHPEAEARVPYVAACLAGHDGPLVAATDYMRSYANQIRPYVDRPYTVLGTDGFGRSDTRANLRRFFEVDRHYVAIAALKSLADQGTLPAARVSEAIARYGIDAERPAPRLS